MIRMICVAGAIALTACGRNQTASQPAPVGVRAQPIRLMALDGERYLDRATEQVGVEMLHGDAIALRFKLGSGIMRQRWGKDDTDSRESWAVPLGIVTHDGGRQLAVATTRCVLDYRYPTQSARPNWSNLALFSRPAENRPDVSQQVFRLVSPTDLPGVANGYDPARDGWFYTSREYLSGPMAPRYFDYLKPNRIANATAVLPVGDWGNTSGVDLAVVYFPLSDSGVAALNPTRNLGMKEPVQALAEVLGSRTSLWGDTFEFSLVSKECMAAVAKQLRTVEQERDQWQLLAIAAGVALVAPYLTAGLGLSGSAIVQKLVQRARTSVAKELWRSVVEPKAGTASRGAYWNDAGKLMLRLLLQDGSVREFIVAGVHRMGLSADAADAVVAELHKLLGSPGTVVSTMERTNAMPVASIWLPGSQLEFSSAVIRQGLARLDVTDVGVLTQQPSLVRLAREAIADPDARSPLIEDAMYLRLLRDLAVAH